MPRSFRLRRHRGRPLYFAPAVGAFVDSAHKIILDPTFVFYDGAEGYIAVGGDGEMVACGFGFSDLGKALRKTAESAAHGAEAALRKKMTPQQRAALDAAEAVARDPAAAQQQATDALSAALEGAASSAFSAIGPATGSIFSHLAKDAGRGLAAAGGAVSRAATQAALATASETLQGTGKGVGLFSGKAGRGVDKGSHLLRDHAAHAEQVFGGALRAIGRGESVHHALVESGHLAAHELREVGPYAQLATSMIPGVGTAVALGLGTAVALANGEKLTDAVVDAAEKAVPGGEAARIGFRLGRNVIDGKNVLQAGMDAARNELPPEGRAGFDAAVAIVKGKKIQDAIVLGARRALPPSAQAAFDVAASVASGKMPSARVLEQAAAHLSPEAQAAVHAAGRIAQGGNVLDVAREVASSNLLPLSPEARASITSTLSAAHGRNLADAAREMITRGLPPDAQRIVGSIIGAHGGRSLDELVKQLARGNVPTDVATALVAAEALSCGDVASAGRQLAALYGGNLPPAAARVLSVASTIAAGQSPVATGIAAALATLPPEARPQAQAALAALAGKTPAEAIALLPSLPLSPGARQAAEVAIAAAQGRSPTTIALATMRRALPPETAHAFDAAVAIGTSSRPAAKEAVAAAHAFREVEHKATEVLRAHGLDPHKLTPAAALGDRPTTVLSAAVAMQMPAIRAASRVYLSAKGGDPKAIAFIAEQEAAMRAGDVKAAKVCENLRLAKALQEEGVLRLRRGMRAEEMSAMIDLAKRAVAA